MAPTPIARWTNVPYQRFADNTIAIGVAAEQINGINRVEYTVSDVDNDPPTADQTGTLTTRSWEQQRADCVWCFKIPIDLTALNDGLVTVDATVYSEAPEESYALPQFFLVNDNGGTAGAIDEIWVHPIIGKDTNDGSQATPKQTLAGALAVIDGDGDVIRLWEGSYLISNVSINNTKEWITITKWPGVERDKVRVIGHTGVVSSIKRLRFYNITIRPTDPPPLPAPQWNRWQGLWPNYLWLDRVYFEGEPTASGKSNNNESCAGGVGTVAHGGQLQYLAFTDCEWFLWDSAIADCTLARNCTGQRIGQYWIETTGSYGLYINTFVDSVSHAMWGPPMAHSDVVIIQGDTPGGCMIENLRAQNCGSIGISQAITPINNLSIKNVAIHAVGSSENWLKLGGVERIGTDHILVQNCTGYPQGVSFAYGLTNSKMTNVSTPDFFQKEREGGMTYENCHVEDSSTRPATFAATASCTAGTPIGFVDPGNADLRINSTSVSCYQTGTALDVPGLPLGFPNKNKPDKGAWVSAAKPGVDITRCTSSRIGDQLRNIVSDRQTTGEVTLTTSYVAGDIVFLTPAVSGRLRTLTALIKYTYGAGDTDVSVIVEFSDEPDPVTWYVPDAVDASIDAAIIWSKTAAAASKSAMVNVAEVPMGTTKIGAIPDGAAWVRFSSKSTGTPTGKVEVIALQ